MLLPNMEHEMYACLVLWPGERLDQPAMWTCWLKWSQGAPSSIWPDY